MKARNFKHANAEIAKDQDQYHTLPALMFGKELDPVEGKIVISVKLSFWERLRVLFLGYFWASVMTFHDNLQPQFWTTKRKDVFSLPWDTRLGWWNYYVFQWFYVRIAHAANRKYLMYWVKPKTGWADDFEFIGSDKARYFDPVGLLSKFWGDIREPGGALIHGAYITIIGSATVAIVHLFMKPELGAMEIFLSGYLWVNAAGFVMLIAGLIINSKR